MTVRRKPQAIGELQLAARMRPCAGRPSRSLPGSAAFCAKLAVRGTLPATPELLDNTGRGVSSNPQIMPGDFNLNAELIRRYCLWLSGLGFSAWVQHEYPRTIREFCKSIRNKPIALTTPWDVRKFLIQESTRGLHYNTIQNLVIALRNFTEFLDLGGIRSTIPVREVRLRPWRRNPPHVVSPDTISRLAAAARRPRDVALVELLYATGCRPGELTSMRVEDIDFESRKIRVKGKNGKVRYVIFGNKAACAVNTYLHGRTTGYLFQPVQQASGRVFACSRNGQWVGRINVVGDSDQSNRRQLTFNLGSRREITLENAWDVFRRRIRGFRLVPPKKGPLHIATLCRILAKLAARIGIKRVSTRTFRHCFATHMLDGGADIREIQELMGHSRLTSTEYYSHTSRHELTETFDRCHPRGAHSRVKCKSAAR